MRDTDWRPAAATLAAAVRAGYGLAVTGVTPMPGGLDTAAAVWRVSTRDGPDHVLKVRRDGVCTAALVAPSFGYEHGLHDVVAPLPTTTGALWFDVDGVALVLYRHIAGRVGMDRGLTAAQWRSFGTTIGRMHALPLPAAVTEAVPVESYTPRWDGSTQEWDSLRRLDTQVTEGMTVHHGTGGPDPLTAEVTAFWRCHTGRIRALVDCAEVLARRLRDADLPLVLCHADLHTGNVLVEPDGRLWIVDWDEAILAPKERDLMFAVGGGISRAWVGERDEEQFLLGYGDAGGSAVGDPVNPLALAYYRHAWAVQDIASFGEEIFTRPDLDEPNRREAARYLRGLFEPGEIVELAGESHRAGW